MGLTKIKYVFRYTFVSNLILVLNLDLGKCPNQKTHESESADFLLWALPEIQNQFPKQIWLKNIVIYISLKKNESVLFNNKKVKKMISQCTLKL